MRIIKQLEKAGLRCRTRLQVGNAHTQSVFGRGDGTWTNTPPQVAGVVGDAVNRTTVPGGFTLRGDSTFPGQGLNAVAFQVYVPSRLLLWIWDYST